MTSTFFKRLITVSVLASTILLSGCLSTTSKAVKVLDYDKKIQSLAFVDQRGFADRYSMLDDRTAKITQKLSETFANKKISFVASKFRSNSSGLELNAGNKTLASVNSNATHVLIMRITRAVVTVHVDFYDLEFTLIDRSSNTEVWKSSVQANWYSKPEEIVQMIENHLSLDNLL